MFVPPDTTAKAFAIRLGQAQDRLDVNYNRLGPKVEQRLSLARFALRSIGEMAILLQYGCSKRATDSPVGVPMIRMNNLSPDGWTFSSLKYAELSSEEVERWRLEKGDILINRTNSKELVGKCEVFQEDGVWVFASYLIRLRVNPTETLPEFVSAFLGSPTGRAQIDRESRQIIGMSNINAEEIKGLRIPVPDLPTQTRLIDEFMRASEAARAAKVVADGLLRSIDEVVLPALGLNGWGATEGSAYAVTRDIASRAGKLNPEYFHPERVNILRELANKYDSHALRRLEQIADFVRDQRRVAPMDEYVGLANVERDTGELSQSDDEEGAGSCFAFDAGDILFARLRPYLNKVHRASKAGVCSTEFHVIRVKTKTDGARSVNPDYLAAVLRSILVLAQTRHMMTGNTHPRLANEDVANLVIPIPSAAVQTLVASTVEAQRDQARRLRTAAKQEAAQAYARFEMGLIAEAPETLEVQ